MCNSFDHYLMGQEIFQRGENWANTNHWEDLYKDFLEAAGMVSCEAICNIYGSLYLEALLKRWLKRKESKETTNLILEVMLYTGIVGVEMLDDITITNERVDQLLLETSEGMLKANLNLNKVDCRVGEIDHWVEILEESCHHYQEFLVADQQCQISYNWEIQMLKV